MGIVPRSLEFCLALRYWEMTETRKKAPSAGTIDALLPPEMALACEAAGVAKLMPKRSLDLIQREC